MADGQASDRAPAGGVQNGLGIDPVLAARISGGKDWEPVPDDLFVIDGVAHTYHFAEENWVPGSYARLLVDALWGIHEYFTPRQDRAWILPPEMRGMQDADLLGHSMFGESRIDACIYHHLPIFPLFKDGGGPISVGKEMRQRWPGRVAIYGGLSPYRPDALDEIDRMVEEDGVIAFKFYPLDLVGGEVKGIRMDDETLMFPLYERMMKHGIGTVAMHKAIAFGPVGHRFFGMDDVSGAAVAFPDLNFEIFHGGFAFLEDTALKATYSPNVTINLEGTSALVFYAPDRLGHVLGSLMLAGAADRIVWGTGVPVIHPEPFLQAFWNYQIPEALQEGYAYPPLTPEIKRMMLSGTQARIAGLDVAAMKAACAGDEFDRNTSLAAPWTSGRVTA
ncbi:amidohydrolase family protein [Marinibaculum pumilum]|uniref:Amidohydrolase family protein n=1 Tax=Marinibaculum pumilum TaxID=1766165 RepID=A0ABV7KZF1_9PROT